MVSAEKNKSKVESTLMDRVELGKQLKQQREWRFITQDKVTELTGLSRKQIIAIEKGTVDYRIDTLFKFLSAINADISLIKLDNK